MLVGLYVVAIDASGVGRPTDCLVGEVDPIEGDEMGATIGGGGSL